MDVKIIGLTIGNPWDIYNWSNIPYHLFTSLKSKGCLLDAIGVTIPKELDLLLKSIYGIYTGRRTKLFEITNRSYLRRGVLGFIAGKKIKRYSQDKIAILSTTTLIDTRKLKIPVFVYIDATLYQAYNLNPNYKNLELLNGKCFEKINKLEEKILKSYAGIFVFSEWVRDSLVNDYRIDDKKVIVAGYAANLPQIQDFDKRQFERPILLSVVTDFYRKGGEITIQTYKILKRNFPDLKLVLVGNVPESVKLQLELEIEIINFLRKDKEDDLQKLISLYREASIFILPSIYDTMPNVILEAMYMKTPVVASNVCGIPEMVKDGETGFLVKSFKPEDYAEKVTLLLNNDKLRLEFGENARRRVLNKFTWDKVTDKIINSIFNYFS